VTEGSRTASGNEPNDSNDSNDPNDPNSANDPNGSERVGWRVFPSYVVSGFSRTF